MATAAAASPSTAGSSSTPAYGCCRRRRAGVSSSLLQRRLFSFFPPLSPVAVRVGGAGGRGVKWKSRGVPTAAASTGGGGGDALPPTAVTFSASISTDLPLYDSPEASIEEYLDDHPRIFGAMFPDSRRSRRINDEWRVQMLPIQFLFASVNPVVVMRLRCRSQGRGYPPRGVPPHVPRVLELRATRWELQGLEGGLVPPHFALDVRGLLYPDRGEEGGGAAATAARRSRLRGYLETSISLVLPPVLALVPEHVLRSVAESVLKRLVERMKQEVDGSLLSDFQSFRRERMRKRLSWNNTAQQHPARSDADPRTDS